MNFFALDVWVSMEKDEVIEFVDELTQKIMGEFSSFKGVNIEQASHTFAENFLHMLKDDSIFDEFSISVSDVSEVSEDEVYKQIEKNITDIIRNIFDDCICSMTKEDLLEETECKSFSEYIIEENSYILYETEDKCWYLENVRKYNLTLN